jgi:hypothetical protein
MSLSKINPRSILLILFVLLTAVIRVVAKLDPRFSSIANFSPIGAMALFGGAYFTKEWKAFGFPLLALFVSDLILSFTVLNQFRHGLLYGGWYWIYGTFVLTTLAGKWIINQVTVSTVLLSVFFCVFIHWIVTDFGVWLNSTLYAKTPGGFIDCLIAAIPFELSFLAGTIVYSFILFGTFEWMQHRYPVLKYNTGPGY